jgi:hypothetical protein
MQNPLIALAILFALFCMADEGAIAQVPTVSPTPTHVSKRALRKLDRQDCKNQAGHENIRKRNQAGFVRQCMADRQGTRKAAEKHGAPKQRTMPSRRAREKLMLM